MLQLKLIEKLAEKQKWMERFCGAYKGGLLALHKDMFGPIVRFYVAIDRSKELGFMRMYDISRSYTNRADVEVWSLSDAYVKPPYRGNGVLREMISQAVGDLNVKRLYISADRLKAYRAYYSTLGFTHCCPVNESGLCYVYLGSFIDTMEASNDAYYRKAA